MTLPTDATPHEQRKTILTPGGLFLLIGLLVGGIFCVVIPYGAGFDEETHMARIFEISGLTLLPNQSNKNHDAAIVPHEFFDFSYQRRYFQTPAFDLFSPEKFLRTIDLKNFVPHRTTSVYPPVNFFVQAFVAGVGWRLFNFPVIPVAILCRVAGMLVYVLGTYLAIRLLPVGKWVMAVLALAPMALYQACTLNADGFTNVISFLFIALVLKYSVTDPAPIRTRQVLGVATLCLVLGLAKQGAIAILPLLLILPFQRSPSKKIVGLLGVSAGLAIVLTVGWSLWALPNTTFGSESNQSVTRSAALVLANLGDFIGVFIRGVIVSIPRYYREWVGVYGHWLGTVPEVTYWIYPIAILAALLAEPRTTLFSRKTRLWTLAAFLAAAAATAFLFYFLYYRPGGIGIAGVQGRYFTPLTPLLYLPLAGLIAIPARLSRIAHFLAVGLVGVTIALFSLGLAATYYTDCGKMLYTTEPCTQPIYKNIDKTNAPEIEINTETTVSQTFTLVCGPLESVEVHVKSVNASGSGSLHYALLDATGQLLDQNEIPVAKITAGKYQNFPFSRLIGERGQVFEIRFDTRNMPPNQGVVVGTSTDKQYSGGNLTVSGSLKAVDLIFHYSCANPWTRLGQ